MRDTPRIQSECGKIRGNADQNNSEYILFLRRVSFLCSVRMQENPGKMRTRIAPNANSLRSVTHYRLVH